jgi:nitrite reductase/ring-hydroxylating ferredoxin subunit
MRPLDEAMEELMPESEWVRVASASEVATGQVIAVKLGDRDVALYHLDSGEFCATDNVCTHEFARLSNGFLEDNEIECPLHAGRFDVRTGAALCPPVDTDLEVFEVKLSGDDVLIKQP